MRSTRQHVMFHLPFKIRGMDGQEPPGTYTVVTDEEEIPGLSFQAWRRVSTVIRLPSDDRASAQEQYTTIDPQDLIAAQERDAAAAAPQATSGTRS
jgi:hypothetical protein